MVRFGLAFLPFLQTPWAWWWAHSPGHGGWRAIDQLLAKKGLTELHALHDQNPCVSQSTIRPSKCAEHTFPGSLVEGKYLPGTGSELQLQVAGYNTWGCEAYKEVQARPTSYETNRHKKICSLEQHTFGNIQTISGMPGPL
jgi:hypothetical protein